MTLQQQLESGVSHHQAGRLADAERIYRQILAQQPNHADALHLLGVLAVQAGRLDTGVELIRRAIDICSTNSLYYSNLGKALVDLGRFDEAIAACRQAIRLNPDFAEAHNHLGNALQDKGQLDESIAAYRQAIRLKPDHAKALHNLGTALHANGQPDEAIAAYGQALRLKPDFAEAHYSLGIALQAKGQLEEATTSYRQAIVLKPDYADAYGNLGNALQDKGQLDEAIAAYQQAIRLNPDFAEAHNSMGAALLRKRQADEAVACFRHAIRLKPDFAEAHDNLGNALKNMGQLDEAIACFQQAIRLKPDDAESHYNHANALLAQGQFDEAIAAYSQAIRLKPDYAEAHSNLGNALRETGQFDEAVASYRQAVQLKPDLAGAHSNLGNALKDRGQLDEAIAAYRQANRLQPTCAETQKNLGAAADAGQLDEATTSQRQAIRLKPDYAGQHSNLILTLHYHPGCDARMIHEELRRWNRQHAEPLKKFIQPHHNNRDPDRCLRIGYVSADFLDHASAFFLLPLFRNHDRRQVEVFCYSHQTHSDQVTLQMKDHVQHWRTTVGQPDAKVAAQIREDQIDVLVDLKLHTGGNSLLIFAQKPAPVQATWLGYPGSTGLDTMDYRLTDPYLDPPGLDDAYYSERSIHLPDTFWCYDPLANEPAVNAPPCLEKGFITFGCLNTFCKINDAVLTLWAGILKTVSNSRLLLLAPEGSSRQRALDRLGREGIGPERVEFVARQSRLGYLLTYHRIDIGLDTVPYNGHTTSLDSFWMGVPVIALVGQTAVGRAGLSQLTNLGLPELVARTPEQYLQIAADLAGNLPRLAELRRTLRARMQASPLMDAPRFARNVERAYREMWKHFISSPF